MEKIFIFKYTITCKKADNIECAINGSSLQVLKQVAILNIKIWQIALKIISETAVGGKKICGNFKKKFDEINNPITNKNVPKIIDFFVSDRNIL